MKSKKGIILTIIFSMIAIFVVLIMLASAKYNREEANIEYANLMKKHMEEKYSKAFEIVDMEFPKRRNKFRHGNKYSYA